MNNLNYFQTSPFGEALRTFFAELSIPVNEITLAGTAAVNVLKKEHYKEQNEAHLLINKVYPYATVSPMAFESIAENLTADTIPDKYNGLLLFGVELHSRAGGQLPSRTHLAEITRAFNRRYQTPVTIIFKYSNYIAFANSERTNYDQTWREGEKIGKVSLLKDIDIISTHTGHLRILNDIRVEKTGKNAVNTFEELYSFWQRVFSTDVLTEKFYKELSNWYAWAISQVEFPNDVLITNPQEKIKHNSPNVIRLLTRTLFVWFMKHKGLIPNELFDEKYLKDNLLKGFDPHLQSGLFLEKSKDSIYYKAILQNLFFATLNCPISSLSKEDSRERAFRKSDNYGQHQDVNHLMRYEKHFKNPQLFLDLVNSKVPFLNGGLFDCLDAKTANPPLWIDGFSDNLKSVQKLVFPDFLFFGETENGKNVDLTWFYGEDEKKPKKVIATVKGLFNILESYYFTVEENTPYEQEVSLDPELLGKVFENLLASFNPETKSSARKQTGSFYTPREIVQYMVDESLIAYLKNVVGDDKEEELRTLISYSEKPVAFTNAEKESIIKALFICKILDPACGSGAFPMGILQKMVHILRKLDDKNTFWRKIVEENAKTESIDALTDTENDKEELLRSIGETFDKNINYPDYARKLYLIENCIYGVDIQPIAVQISKLRFFISLVVEQQPNNEPNFGIKPLPNLEAKFVAANTLIGIGKKDATLFDSETIKQKEEQLRKFNHKIYSAGSPKTKTKYKEKIKELRLEIANELEDIGAVGNAEAHLLTSWDMFNQNASSPFFDPVWMFGIKDGFDLVIGNPPYIKVQSIPKNQANYFKSKYISANGKYDIYVIFTELSLKLISKNGTLSFIIPHRFLIAEYGKDLRNIIYKKKSLSKLIHFGVDQIFDKATTYTGIFFFKENSSSFRFAKPLSKDLVNLQFSSKLYDSSTFNFLIEDNEDTIIAKINKHKKVSQIFNGVCQGLIPMGDDINILEGKYEGEIFKGFSKALNKVVTIESEIMKPLLKGENIKRYLKPETTNYIFYPHYTDHKGKTQPFSEDKMKIDFPQAYNYILNFKDELIERKIKYKTNSKYWYSLHRSRKQILFESPKIITPQLQNHSSFTFDNCSFYADAGGYILPQKENDKVPLISYLAIFNSKLFYYFIKKTSTPYNNNYFYFKTNYIEPFCIPVSIINYYVKFENIASKILEYKIIDKQPTDKLERQIDELVYKLYDLTYDEVQVVEDGKFWLSEEDYAKISVE